MYRHMLRQDISIIINNGATDEYGEDIDANEFTLKARVESTNKTKRTPTGEVIPLSLIVWIAAPARDGITSGAKLNYKSQSHRIDSMEEIPDGSGRIRLVELQCVEWRQ